MNTMPTHADTGGTPDRVRCAYCGANNFPASPACWQCGRQVRPLSAGTTANAPEPSTRTQNTSPSPRWNAGTGLLDVSPGLAPKAAAALGLMLPWAGLPVGIVFLMLDDARKVRLGWIAIGWSIVGTILNLLLLVPPLIGAWSLVKSHAPAPGGGIPGLPPMGGGDMNFMSLWFPMF